MEYLIDLLGVLVGAVVSVVICLINNKTTRQTQFDTFLKNYDSRLNGIKEDYRDGLQKIKETITSVKNDNDKTFIGLEIKVQSLTDEVKKLSALTDTVTALKLDINALKTRLDALERRNNERDKEKN